MTSTETDTAPYNHRGPSPEEVRSSRGSLVLEFGTDWCGFCRAAQAPIAEAFSRFPQVQHLKIEDGPGRRLGRYFRVKLWPTLVFLRDGAEVARAVRPTDAAEVLRCLEHVTTAADVDSTTS